MWKLVLRPRYSFSGNICFKFSAFCLCSVLLGVEQMFWFFSVNLLTVKVAMILWIHQIFYRTWSRSLPSPVNDDLGLICSEAIMFRSNMFEVLRVNFSTWVLLNTAWEMNYSVHNTILQYYSIHWTAKSFRQSALATSANMSFVYLFVYVPVASSCIRCWTFRIATNMLFE